MNSLCSWASQAKREKGLGMLPAESGASRARLCGQGGTRRAAAGDPTPTRGALQARLGSRRCAA